MDSSVPYKVVFFGTPENALSSLENLLSQADFQVVAVVTQPDKKQGRGMKILSSAVKNFAIKHNISYFQPEKSAEIKKFLIGIEADFFVVVSYGLILTESVLNMPKFGTFNVHFSLLPKYRGAAPMQAAILAGDDSSGVSVIKMKKELDAGEVVLIKRYQLNSQTTVSKLAQDLAELGGHLLIDALRIVVQGNLKLIPQNEREATCCRKVYRNDGKIYWNLYCAFEIARQINAFSDWPGCFSTWNGKRVKFFGIFKVVKEGKFGKAGEVVKIDNEIGICAKKGLFIPREIQLEGKKPIEFAKFSLGYSSFVGSILGKD